MNLSKLRVNAAQNSLFLTETTYPKLINDVKKAKMTTKKEPRDYWFLNRYDVMLVEALRSKRAEEVAYNLVDIFSLIGAPSILQYDNGREFANNVVTSLKEFWPALKIVHGKPRHSQSQGSVERAKQDIENSTVFGCRTTNLTSGVKDCGSFNL
ncbi:SCAN domain-containing protein 3 [Araneus ventricosus]|uniref:SCAN domain-containing protein 3 n=1 Tax=Araneus ventricosus TaxID=182803 RepID=A0A4Y2AL02_ARAVE|nr:SCAN domain-containing protein 3 [Araneus ventricosus]